MKFGDFKMLTYLWWIIPVLAFFYLWAWKRRKKLLLRFAQKPLLEKIEPYHGSKMKIARPVFIVLAVSMMAVALAGPRWGFFWKENKAKGLDIMFAIDTSRSMLATDLVPDRIGFAKESVMDFVRSIRSDRVGLMAFAGEAFVACPLTLDHSGFELVLSDLRVGTIPKGGTSIAEAVNEAVRNYEGAARGDKILVLITDGENTAGDLDKAVLEAKKAGIVIFAIGIGSPEGEVIPVPDEKGGVTYLKDEKGNVVRSSLDEKALEKIAAETGGAYVRAAQEDLGLRRLYEERLSQMEKRETKGEMVKVYEERFQLFLGAALVLLIMAFI